MKILFIEWKSFGNQDMKNAFAAEGHTVACFPFSNKDSRKDAEVEAELVSFLHQETPDLVFSFNYFPVISNVCKKEDIRYISWIYDSPYVMLYSYTVINPCNEIYVFDKELYMEFHNAGIHTVYYMPLAANTERLDKILPAVCANGASNDTIDIAASDVSSFPYLYDISFIGSLYNESHNFFDRMTTLSDYTKGYLDAIMSAQMRVQGYNFIQESLSPIMDDLYQALPMDPNPDGVESKEYLYAQYVINRKITGLERMDLIHTIAERFRFDLFTPNASFTMPGLTNHGTVDYYEQAPLVFKQSKINLNISLRSIKSGVPLRAFDILGSGGFLLSNFQADYLDDFIPGEDFDYYESREDLIDKITYYLTHDEERIAIARNGHDKVTNKHTFRHRVREMLR
ncbi:MAG: glycosyltransferase [Lachnospiraceae bacterium]|nr:glycosyltransferase [Lachnospiraceae bacterium]